MNSHPFAQPQACAAALEHIHADPLELPEATLGHLLGCPGCAEARVAWLAQEEAPLALTPAGYFDHLPGRILAKLPAASPRPARHRLWWAAAAAFLLLAGTGGFLLGQRGRSPVTEATLTVPTQDSEEVLPDTPFQDGDEDSALTPEELQKVLAPAQPQTSQP